MSFSFYYAYPNRENPEIIVDKITGGYKFTLYNKNGAVNSSFVLSSSIVHNIIAATGLDGDEAMAVEKFREFGKNQWPNTFK